MKKSIIALIILSVGLLLSACSQDNGSNEPAKEQQDIKEMVSDYSGNKDAEVSASVTSSQLVLTDKDEKKTTYDLPKDEFFVAIAPYIETTHPCETHSLTGCQGELTNKEFDLYIEDDKGNVIMDETVKSQSNGFIDLWLPRDKTYKVNVTRDGKKAEQEISTFDGDLTCISTMQLM
jgi:hypothetical protein